SVTVERRGERRWRFGRTPYAPVRQRCTAATARLEARLGSPLELSRVHWVLGSRIFSACCSVLRLHGDYLVIVTLGVGEIVTIVARNWPELANGAMGLNGVQAPVLFGYSFGIISTPYTIWDWHSSASSSS